jgi:hypothetical protein
MEPEHEFFKKGRHFSLYQAKPIHAAFSHTHYLPRFIPLTVVKFWVTVVLKEPLLGWRSNYEGRLKILWTGGSAPLLYCYASLCITAAHCRQSTNFSNRPRTWQKVGARQICDILLRLKSRQNFVAFLQDVLQKLQWITQNAHLIKTWTLNEIQNRCVELVHHHFFRFIRQ